MQIIELPQFTANGLSLKGKKSSVTIGVFDGVHRGHQSLIERIVSHNTENVPVVITFRENHKTGNNAAQTDIYSFEQRLKVFKSLGVKITVAIDFTDDIRQMAGIKFLEILLKHGSIGFFAVGSNFRCGYKLDTGAEEIKRFFAKHNIPAEIVPEVMEGSLPVSSSRIRSAIAAGDIPLAEKMLGRKVAATVRA